jgi:hypothetical protein
MMGGNERKKENTIVILVSINIMILAAIFIFFSIKGIRADKTLSGIPKEVLRDAGNKLKAVGLEDKATDLYEIYLSNESLDTKTRANISFSIAKMYIKGLNFKEALKWFYIVESLDKDFSGKDDLNRYIVLCLEKLDKGSAAEYALQARSQFGKEGTETEKVGEVIAVVGGGKITLNEIREAFNKLPEWMRKSYDNPEGKVEYARSYIAEELLFKKGLKLNYDQDEEIKKQINNQIKAMVINKVLDEDIKQKITIPDDDLKNYYDAFKDTRYIKPEKVDVSIIKTDSKKVALRALKEIKDGLDFKKAAEKYSNDSFTREKGGKLDITIIKGDEGIPRVGKSTELVDKVLSMEKGDITDALKMEDSYFIIRVDEKIQRIEPKFEDIKENVKSDYYNQKFSKLYQEMVDSILSSVDVEFYPEKIK